MTQDPAADLSTPAAVLALARKLHQAAQEPHLPGARRRDPPTTLLLPAEAALLLLQCRPADLDPADQPLAAELRSRGTLLGMQVHLRACAKTLAAGDSALPRLHLRDLGHPVAHAQSSCRAADLAAATCPALSPPSPPDPPPTPAALLQTLRALRWDFFCARKRWPGAAFLTPRDEAALCAADPATFGGKLAGCILVEGARHLHALYGMQLHWDAEQTSVGDLPG